MPIYMPDAAEILAACPDDEAFTMGPIPDALQATLDDLLDVLPASATVSLMRDWEHCPVAMVTGANGLDVLALTERGRIGFGGVNMPAYFDSVKDFLNATAPKPNAAQQDAIAATVAFFASPDCEADGLVGYTVMGGYEKAANGHRREDAVVSFRYIHPDADDNYSNLTPGLEITAFGPDGNVTTSQDFG